MTILVSNEPADIPENLFPLLTFLQVNNSITNSSSFADIIVTQQKGVHPYVGQWWPPGHIIGYEHTFVHTIADFVNAVAMGKSVQPTFEDGLKNQQVLEAVEKSAETRRWVKV